MAAPLVLAEGPEQGAALYQQYCATCHGERGGGNGPMVPYLTVKPSDLRTISARNQGVFPREELTQIVDGTKEIVGHGPRTMPIWGERLQDDVIGGVNKSAVAQGRIGFLLDYLETLQGTDKKPFENIVLPTPGLRPGTDQ
ncbi:MAG: cytochrome c [Candidatus Binatia bacterium]